MANSSTLLSGIEGRALPAAMVILRMLEYASETDLRCVLVAVASRLTPVAKTELHVFMINCLIACELAIAPGTCRGTPTASGSRPTRGSPWERRRRTGSRRRSRLVGALSNSRPAGAGRPQRRACFRGVGKFAAEAVPGCPAPVALETGDNRKSGYLAWVRVEALGRPGSLGLAADGRPDSRGASTARGRRR